MKRFLIDMAMMVGAVCLSLFVAQTATAQMSQSKNYVTVQISPDSENWTYETGDDVEFTISVVRSSIALKNVEVSYQWGPELRQPVESGTINTGKGYNTLKLKGMKQPGFMTLRASVEVDGRRYSNYINVGFEPEKITGTVKMPADFDEFWAKAVSDAQKVPLDPMMTYLPDRSTNTVDYYHVRFNNNRPGIYVYGILCVPKDREGKKLAAVMNPPGAGVKTIMGDPAYAEQGVVSLAIGIHGIPLLHESTIYRNLNNNGLGAYSTSGIDDRDKYYFKHVYTGCVRAIDFLISLPYVDAERIGVHGGSQGGALTIVTAALDHRVKYISANYPALCDIAGAYYGSASGWPKILNDPNETNREKKVEVVSYFDVVNFASRVKAEGFYCLGYNDQTCPPTTTFAAYNNVKAPKQLLLPLDCAHWQYPEHSAQMRTWLIEQLTK